VATAGAAGAHSHTLSRAVNGGTFTNVPFPGHNPSGTFTTSTDGTHVHPINVAANGSHNHAISVTATGGHETRPRNLALLYCIKY
jgi:hypothetical protein